MNSVGEKNNGNDMILNEKQMHWFDSHKHWGVVTIVIHWLSALLIFGLFSLGLWMVELDYYDTWYRKAPDLHKSIGILLFVLTIGRLVWRRSNSIPEALGSHNSRERRIAEATHYSLYILLLTIMLSGYLISTADGHAIVVFNWLAIPATIYGIDMQEDIAGIVHLWLAVSLISLVVLHAMAALKHHFFDRDQTLKRMFGL